ncbi:MAG: prepilin peptidase [Nitrososphaerales archaeon]
MIVNFLFVNLSLAAAMLLYTSYLDLRKREVEDKVWVIFGIVGAALEAYEVAIGETGIIALGISIALAGVIGMGLYFFGFYGGADGKALVVVGVLVPHFVPNVGLYSVAPLIVLTNGVLISILLPMAILLFNIARLLRKQPIFEGFSEPWYRKALACFLGYKQLGKPREFQFGMEKTVSKEGPGDQVKKFDFAMLQDDFETEGNTWVTPGIPLLVFFTIGYFVMLFYGDIVIALIQSLTRLAGF